MNDKERVEITEAWDGPGAILRNAREARGLDAAAVAAMLHLSQRKLNALETDDFDALPEPVFVRGYLKNYARLLEEPVTPILEAYARCNPGVEINEQPPLDSHVAVEVGSGHGIVKMISIVIVVVLIALPLIWWWDYLELAAQKIVGKGVSVIEQEIQAPGTSKKESGLAEFIPPPPPGSVVREIEGEPPTVTNSSERVTATLNLSSTMDKVEPVVPAITEQPTITTDSAPIPVPPKPEVVEAKPDSEPKPAVVVKPEKPVAAVPKITGTVFEFVESSWIKVRDANDRVILIGEYKKGERKKLSGEMPYKVVLGNAPAVRITIDGKVAPIDKFSSGGVARFTINGGKIENP